MELTEGRILLREFTQEDVSGLLAIHSDPRVLRYYPPELGTQEHARMLVGMFIRWANEYPRDNFQFAIVDRPATREIRCRPCDRPRAQVIARLRRTHVPSKHR